MNIDIDAERESVGIYVHFPFCVRKCDYCDFYSISVNSHQSPELNGVFLAEFGRVLRNELEGRKASFSNYKTVSSVYFGGGTSSLMPPWFVKSLLKEFNSIFPFRTDCEITVEGNAEHMSHEYLQGLKDAGVNRINVGIQSFNFTHLTTVQRRFHPGRYASILRDLADSGIKHHGIDLMYGFPGQTVADFRKDLERVFSSSIDHISMYSLTVEPGTLYESRIKSGLVQPPNEQVQLEIFNNLADWMREAGFQQYEVSNFARNGAVSRHNLRYWNYLPYIGLGPGAHGFDGKTRYGNPDDLDAYIIAPLNSTGDLHDPITDLLLGILRLSDRISIARIRDVFLNTYGEKEMTRLMTIIDEHLTEWEKNKYGYLSSDSGDSQPYFKWTTKGMLFLDDRILELTVALDECRSSVPPAKMMEAAFRILSGSHGASRE